VVCIAFGFRGPTLNLLAPPQEGVPLGLFMASRWLARNAASYALVAACHHPAAGRYLARAVLLTSHDSNTQAPPPDHTSTAAWLTATEATAE
jgi:hypothetical protein